MLRKIRDKKKERKQTQKNGIMKKRQRSKRMKKKMKRKSDFRDRTLKKTETQSRICKRRGTFFIL